MGDRERRVSVARRLWRVHSQSDIPPDLCGEDLNGVNMVELDEDVRRCVSAWMASRGPLDAQGLDLMLRCLGDIERASSLLASRRETLYVERLRELATLAAVDGAC